MGFSVQTGQVVSTQNDGRGDGGGRELPGWGGGSRGTEAGQWVGQSPHRGGRGGRAG